MAMKKFFYIVWVATITFSSGQSKPIGRYEGALSRDGSVQLVSFNFSDEGLEATYEIPECGLYDVPVRDYTFQNDTLSIRFFYGNFFLFLDDTGNELTGISERWEPKLRIHLKKVEDVDPAFSIEQIQFPSGEISLSGMLYHPDSELTQPLKYVVLVHGSGYQDRYSPYYISLGHQLASRGIGVLLYDKRGTGISGGDRDMDVATFDDLARDANAALTFLSKRNDLKSSKIGLLGTSQGGWISTKAASQSNLSEFLIFNVGPSVSLFDQDIHRIKYTMTADDWSHEAIDAALTYSESYFRYARTQKRRDWDQLKMEAKRITDEDWTDYVNIPTKPEDMNWWIINAYDPRQDLTRLKIPVLSLFGGIDPLVPPEENEAKMRRYLSDAGVPFQVRVIPNVGHDMKTYHGLNGNNWNWPKVYWQWRKQPDEYIESIVDFIKVLR